MSSEEPRKSDRFQIITAVLFMGLFAALTLIVGVPNNGMASFVCNYARDFGPFARMCSDVPSPGAAGELVTARITSVCLNNEGLNISVAFDEPLTGASTLQVFTTGDDYFPSEQGISDSFRMSMTIPAEAKHLDFVIPVDLMPVGEQIFGNIAVNDEGVTSFVAYSIYVSDCALSSAAPSDSLPEDAPVIRSATCLPSQHLMIAFEFQGPVFGQYRASVNDIPYELASVINQPATLFFSGDAPPAGPVLIRLLSATHEATIFEDTYTPPVCSGT